MERAWRIITSTRQERTEQYGHPLYAGAADVSDDTRFEVIPPGVNTRVFSTAPGELDGEVAARLDERLHDPRQQHLLVSSRIDPKKNIAGTVEAWVNSPELHERAGLVICVRGLDDPFEELDLLSTDEQAVLRPILDMIAGAGLRDRVDFLDIRSQAELAAAYRYFARRRSVFVLTAYYEPFGLAPIEAAACGLACVATQNGGPSEIFADGSGVLVDPFDAEDIARGLARALDGHQRLSEMAQRRVAVKYTWDKTAAGYLEVIEQGLAANPSNPGPVPTLDASARIAAYLA